MPLQWAVAMVLTDPASIVAKSGALVLGVVHRLFFMPLLFAAGCP